MLSPDMLEGLLRQTSTMQGTEHQGVVVQGGTEQEVVLLWGKGLGVAEGRMWDKELGAAEGRMWDKELGVAEGRMWDKGLGVAEEKTCGTGGQHIVQSDRQPLVEAHT